MKLKTITLLLSALATTFLVMGCSSPLEGLWIADNDEGVLKFEGTKVIINSFYSFHDTLTFTTENDSLTVRGFNAVYGMGTAPRSYKYRLEGDSLKIWWRHPDNASYVKSQWDSYVQHHLTQGNVKLTLPKAESVTEAYYHGPYLDIKIGFKHERIIAFVDGEEVPSNLVESRIKRFTDSLFEGEINYVKCRLFIDNDVPCEYMTWLFPALRNNNVRVIYFITMASGYDVYSRHYLGIRFVLQPKQINFVEE